MVQLRPIQRPQDTALPMLDERGEISACSFSGPSLLLSAHESLVDAGLGT